MFSRSSIRTTVENLQAILNALPSPILIKDRNHQIVVANQAACEFLGVPQSELVGSSDEQLPEEQRAVFWEIDDHVFQTGERSENEEVVTDARGEVHVMVTRKRLIQLETDEGNEPFILAILSDVTKIREAEARAVYLAEHDPLTGLSNRNQLIQKLIDAINLSKRNGAKVGLLLLDLDGFKQVNDRYGHAVGDELLRVVARRLSTHIRIVDSVARIGGDEFCIVQVGLQQPAGAFTLAERLVSALEQPIVVGEIQASVSASIGIALFPDDASSEDELYRNSDMALYAVKKSGGSGYLRFDHPADSHEEAQWNIEKDLRGAITRGEISLVYQPLRATEDSRIVGYEALARWDHPEKGAIPPEVFVPVAETTGIIRRLGNWILKAACRDAATWPEDVRVSVNVSSTQLEDGQLVETIENALEISGLSPSRLELEIKESALIGQTDRIGQTFSALKKLGIRLALDDFGAGSSSISSIQRLPFDRIKIDRSFVSSLASDARSVAIVRAILAIGKELNLSVTAEGVENEGQLVALRHMGCPELQGYLLGRPAPLPNADDQSEPAQLRDTGSQPET
ncbi:putative bifunctional diguanylate cyclase/phosphodiesterase [Amorphus sp. 3PC139-8]|uniref:putative bifunctional diguanylate cyclase/phosphodiesterase n=1 Tax=Amorphus sp. 3PC139-8 TaxID=2735676 RepID=UPI00345D6883